MRVLILAPSRSIHTHKWALYYKNTRQTVILFKRVRSKESDQAI
ncbi:Uncharacterised protein [Mycobacteroides abscessus subsp. abscessus]|nr:Uncharacterised protein [Mycobacteroides abscessus subsp. abscessus]